MNVRGSPEEFSFGFGSITDEGSNVTFSRLDGSREVPQPDPQEEWAHLISISSHVKRDFRPLQRTKCWKLEKKINKRKLFRTCIKKSSGIFQVLYIDKCCCIKIWIRAEMGGFQFLLPSEIQKFTS